MRALDCCAGAGGLSLGLQRAGWDVLGVELDKNAARTHVENVGACDVASLWDYSPRETYELVAGGIPCQSHSTAGKRAGTMDPRGQLYVPFLRIAREANARAVLIENVRGMLSSPSPTHGTALLEVVAAVRAAGFAHVVYRVLNAADYGVPQSRRRLFIVGFARREDHYWFCWPKQTHAERDVPELGLSRWVSVREALGLGNAPHASGRVEGARGWQGMRLLDVDAPAPSVRAGTCDLLDRPAPCVTSSADHQGTSPERPSQRKWGELKGALSALDKPAPCVTATEDKSALDFGREGAATNPRRCGDRLNPLLGAVRLTVEQLAALQSFPAGFAFHGDRAADRHCQVGNAVPPPLAEAVGRSIARAFRKADEA